MQASLTLFFLLRTNLQIGLIFVGLGFIPMLVPRLTNGWLQNGTKTWQVDNQKYTEKLEDTLSGRTLVKRFNGFPAVSNRLKNSLDQSENSFATMQNRQSQSGALVGILYVATTITALFVGSAFAINGMITVGGLITIYMSADRVVTPLINMVRLSSRMLAALPLFAPIFDQREKTAVHEPTFSERQEDDLISIHDVSVGFFNESLLNRISLDIHRGDRILIQGASGSGKSTLVKTLMNELPPLKGEIVYSAELAPNLSDHFSVVEQQPFIFRDTLEFNLTLGRNIPESELITVLKRVGLTKYASKQGLKNSIGPDMYQLSGGELKRLKIARALLYNREILVVDEALSGLDDSSGEEISRLINEYPGAVIEIEHHISSDAKVKFDHVLMTNSLK